MNTMHVLILCTTATFALLAQDGTPQRYDYAEPHMGTLFRIELYAASKEHADRAAAAGFRRVKELDALFSDYQQDSELLRLCQRAGQGPMDVSPEMVQILQECRRWAERSEGGFDVTIGPMVQLWRKARRLRELPKPAAIAEAKTLVDYRLVQIDTKRNQVTLAKPRMRLDLGGIAKGYTCDAVHKVLKQHGITSALVAGGGDIVVSQRPPGSAGWIVSVMPLGKEAPVRLVLENQAASTAGDLEQFVEIEGVRYSHLVDPRTGLGLVGRMSCTIVATHGADSDGADNAVCLLGPEKGLRMIDQHPGLACLYVSIEDGKVKRLMSKEWGKLRFK
jgi:thiamine biosynthesis lipoprotein